MRVSYLIISFYPLKDLNPLGNPYQIHVDIYISLSLKVFSCLSGSYSAARNCYFALFLTKESRNCLYLAVVKSGPPLPLSVGVPKLFRRHLDSTLLVNTS